MLYESISNRRRRVYRLATVEELLNEGFDVVVIDNLSNASEELLKRVEKITEKKSYFIMQTYATEMHGIFKAHQFDRVIHFAGYKAVGESVL